LGEKRRLKEFTINDLRGEYWLYTEGELRVNVGRGGVEGVCHFNTSDVHLESGGPLDSRKVAEILTKLMIEFGRGPGGYSNLMLHNDGKYDLSRDHISTIDQELTKAGFTIQASNDGKEILWVRRKRAPNQAL
jgi:hypothetical protein